MYHSPHWFNPAQFWIDYPHLLISGWMKWYYLVQLGFWIQQIYVLNIEKRRKDHYAMFSHHIITVILIISSYCVNFTRIGNAVLCCMDLADILLPVSMKLSEQSLIYQARLFRLSPIVTNTCSAMFSSSSQKSSITSTFVLSVTLPLDCLLLVG